MDEATSSVGSETCKRVQEIINTKFRTPTIIRISPRPESIAGFDRIIVLDSGSIAEMGSPKALLDGKSSIFAGLVEASGSSAASAIRQIISHK
jgi:ABC-type multidrug transport system fused ATPase/permease subunit